MNRTTGNYLSTTVAGETVNAFVPFPLPPVPPVEVTREISECLVTAEQKLAELKIASELVPNRDLFTYAFVRKEAVYSSQIEGIQATLSDLLNYEASPGEYQEPSDVIEVCNYLNALLYAKKQISNPKGLPLSLRLIREMHKRLMQKGRGASKSPGEFRTTQNWIGGSRPGTAQFVPPPPEKLKMCLGDFEGYLHEKTASLPSLIRLALVHVQFETIHPFLDGNGRLGRLLIALLLESWYGLDSRLLYLSTFFKKHQQDYYRHLDRIRTEGDWEAWIYFFLKGISQTASEAIETARSLFKTFEKDRKRLLSSPTTLVPAIRLFEELPNHPVITISTVVSLLKTTKPTAGKAVEVLTKLGILSETTGAKRNRVFGYGSYLKILKGD